MVDHSNMRLGKLPRRVDSRTLRLARYTIDLPPPPDTADWTHNLSDLGMMLNDQIGDCTCAAIGHMIQVWTAALGNQVVVSDDDILAYYEKACGYDPADPSTDRGGVELDVLNYWRKNPLSGNSLDAYVAAASGTDIMRAIWMFGGCYIGLGLPISAKNQYTWDLIDGPESAFGSWGGHAVPLVAYDTTGLTCITWGQLKRMTWEFWSAYCDESYALLSVDWCGAKGTPSGFDMETLRRDLSQL